MVQLEEICSLKRGGGIEGEPEDYNGKEKRGEGGVLELDAVLVWNVGLTFNVQSTSHTGDWSSTTQTNTLPSSFQGPLRPI